MNSFGFFVDWQLGIFLMWLLYRVALQGRIPHPTARGYLLVIAPLTAAIAALKLPVLSPIVLYSTPTAIETTTTTTLPTTVAISATPVDWLSIGYWAVAAGLTMLFVVGAVRWIARWRKGLELGGVRFCKQGRAVASSMFGRIGVDPCCLGSDALESIVAHERAHVAHRHAWDMLYMSLLRSALWVNPAVWLLARDLVLVHEAQADKAVLEAGFSPERYIHTLLDAEIGAIGGPIPGNLAPIHYFSFCSTKKRIEMMTQLFPSRRSLWRLTAVVPVLGAMLVLFSFTRPVVVETATPIADPIEVQQEAKEAPHPALVVVYQKSTYNGEQFVEFRRSLEGDPELDPKKVASVSVLKGAKAVEYMNLDPASEAGKTIAQGGIMVLYMKGADPERTTKMVMVAVKDSEYLKPLTKNFRAKPNASTGGAELNENYAMIVQKPDAKGNISITVLQRGAGLPTSNINDHDIASTSHYNGMTLVLMKGASLDQPNYQGTVEIKVAPGVQAKAVTLLKQLLREKRLLKVSYSAAI